MHYIVAMTVHQRQIRVAVVPPISISVMHFQYLTRLQIQPTTWTATRLLLHQFRFPSRQTRVAAHAPRPVHPIAIERTLDSAHLHVTDDLSVYMVP